MTFLLKLGGGLQKLLHGTNLTNKASNKCCDFLFHLCSLVQLKTKAKLNKYVKTIGLPKKHGTIPARVKCVVAGWGRTAHEGNTSNVLKETTEMIQFDDECRHIWKDHFKRKSMICTKFDKKKGGVCQVN